MAVALCLRDEDLVRFRADTGFGKLVRWVG